MANESSRKILGFLHRLNPLSWNDESKSTQEQRADLNNQGGMSSWFADTAQNKYGDLGAEGDAARQMLRDQATGKTSVSGEMLRQGLQQQLSQQQSMAASANPANAAMAARAAANNMGRASYGMSGQAAVAGMQEKMAAQQALAQAIAEQRRQELQAALQARQTAVGAYGGIKPEGTALEKWMPAIEAGAGAAGLAAKSDVRAKEKIEDGDEKAKRVLRGLKAYSYDYKDTRDGKGRQFGPMAQDMEKAGLGHAVIDTPEGKVVHGAKAALSGLALTAALAKRVEKLEGKK